MRLARIVVGAATVACGVVVAATATGAGRTDYAAASWNVLPPGQAGGVNLTTNSTDQAKLYDSLTPLQDRVSAATIARSFKRAPLGLGTEKAVRTERPRKGLVIRRDRWGVPHIVGKTDVDVAFGAGWATAQDRQLIMELLRGPGRIAALDAPGIDAFALALQGKTFVPSAATEARLNAQFALLAKTGAKGKRLIRIIDAYIAGINGAYKKAGLQIAPWTRADVVAVGGLVGGVFGNGGGDEARRAAFLSKLQTALGDERGRAAWEDLRLRDDPEARTAVESRFANGKATTELGNAIVDGGSIQGAAALQPASKMQIAASNALLVGAKRSATGHPLAVMGPQVGYFYPEIILEQDLQGGGMRSRRVLPRLLLRHPGRARSRLREERDVRGLDLADQYVETLCGGSDTKYL